MARQIVVEIVGDASKFTSATNQAVTQTGKLGGAIGSVKKGIAGGLGLGAGLGIVSLVTSAVGSLVDVAGDAKEAFEQDQVSAAKLTQALKNNIPGWDGNTAAVEEYALAQQKLGFSDDEVRDSIGQLVGITHDLTEAQELNTLAQDIARAKGIDLASAADAVTKAYNGQSRGLKALGIDVGDAKTGTDLLAAAQRNVQGASEAWAATNEGKLAVSNEKVGEAMEKVGSVVSQVAAVVLPILADALVLVIDGLSAMWDAIQPVVSAIAKALIPIVQKLVPVFKTVIGAVMNIIKALAPVFATVFGVIGKVLEVWFGILTTIFDAVAGVVGVLVKVFQGMGKIVEGVFRGIGGFIKGVINTIIRVINSVIRGINSFRIPKIEIAGNVIFGGWGGLNLRTIPTLHAGGVVPGSPGTEVLALLQAGETVTPAGGGPGQTIIIRIDSFIGSDSDIDRFADKVARRLRIA